MKVLRIQSIFLLAILYVWLYHAFIIWALPDPLFEPDSRDYLGGVLQHMTGGHFDIPVMRGLGYPLLLWGGLKLFGSFGGVLWLQQGLWIATALCSSAIFLKHRPGGYGCAAAHFLIIACSTRESVLSPAILNAAIS